MRVETFGPGDTVARLLADVVIRAETAEATRDAAQAEATRLTFALRALQDELAVTRKAIAEHLRQADELWATVRRRDALLNEVGVAIYEAFEEGWRASGTPCVKVIGVHSQDWNVERAYRASTARKRASDVFPRKPIGG